MPEKRYTVLKPREKKDQLQSNCTDEFEIFYSNVLHYYTARPVELNTISFYFFATWYIVQKYDASKQNLKTTMPVLKLLHPLSDKCVKKKEQSILF